MNVSPKYMIGDKVFFCNTIDDESVKIYMGEIVYLMPGYLDESENPNYYNILFYDTKTKYIPDEDDYNVVKIGVEEFMSEKELFKTQTDALIEAYKRVEDMME